LVSDVYLPLSCAFVHVIYVKGSGISFFFQDIHGWGLSPRGVGFLFGATITKAFTHHNALDLIAQAH
jgi:diadenosine tetraphosphatase ApaH/serine/threonine PP2A family protein phosphatase